MVDAQKISLLIPVMFQFNHFILFWSNSPEGRPKYKHTQRAPPPPSATNKNTQRFSILNVGKSLRVAKLTNRKKNYNWSFKERKKMSNKSSTRYLLEKFSVRYLSSTHLEFFLTSKFRSSSLEQGSKSTAWSLLLFTEGNGATINKNIKKTKKCEKVFSDQIMKREETQLRR